MCIYQSIIDSNQAITGVCVFDEMQPGDCGCNLISDQWSIQFQMDRTLEISLIYEPHPVLGSEYFG